MTTLDPYISKLKILKNVPVQVKTYYILLRLNEFVLDACSSSQRCQICRFQQLYRTELESRLELTSWQRMIL